jgi:hypothetical protein
VATSPWTVIRCAGSFFSSVIVTYFSKSSDHNLAVVIRSASVDRVPITGRVLAIGSLRISPPSKGSSSKRILLSLGGRYPPHPRARAQSAAPIPRFALNARPPTPPGSCLMPGPPSPGWRFIALPPTPNTGVTLHAWPPISVLWLPTPSPTRSSFNYSIHRPGSAHYTFKCTWHNAPFAGLLATEHLSLQS